MDRVNALTRQLLPSLANGQGAVTGGGQQPSFMLSNRLSDEDKMGLMKVLLEYRESVDRFVEDGTFPSMTQFDVQMALKQETGLAGPEQCRALIENAKAEGTIAALDLLPGPWQDCKTFVDQVKAVNDLQMAVLHGDDIFYYAGLQRKYGDRGLASNIVVPRTQPYGVGSKQMVKLISRVIIGDPQDAERLARVHVRKEGNFVPGLYDSLIATADNDHWIKQRRSLTEVFLPLSSLAEIMPVSLARAKECAKRLATESHGGKNAVDMSDFLLHEAQAQLQLALLGAPTEFVEQTNAAIRTAFMGDSDGKVGVLGSTMRSLMERAQTDKSLTLPGDGPTVKGPLSAAVKSSNLSPKDDYGNMLLILFAGHDTTGHTMTWLMMELARHPDIQKELQREVDEFFEYLGGRDPEYRDLSRLKFMDRCVTETLRLWPAVPNGTFRQLQFADTVKGPGGKDIMLPKGTPVQLVNWSRHRNTDLWGPDAGEFNPNRDFKPEELGSVGGPLAAVNPQSERFSPFAHNPRSCLGKNFAQMEMRLIIAYLLRQFDFSLGAAYAHLAENTQESENPGRFEFRGVNRGTMGPMDLERSSEHSWGTRHRYAMKMHAWPRT